MNFKYFVVAILYTMFVGVVISYGYDKRITKLEEGLQRTRQELHGTVADCCQPQSR